MPNPEEQYYIDNIQFSDKTYTIRDFEARLLITDIISRLEIIEEELNITPGGE